jgi:nucleotide-binding universal stress UspA family protein
MHILVATDGSEVSREAVRFGATLTRALGGRLTLVHVLRPSGEAADAEGMLRAAQADAADCGAQGTTRLEVGYPVEVIVELRHKIGADMLVVGTHGRRGMARILLGSVAESLYKSAPCPVAVVGKFDQSATGIGPLLVPTDFSEGAMHAARAATVLARSLGVRLRLLHVLPEALPPKGEENPEATRRQAERLRREAESRLRSLAETLGLDSNQVDLSLVVGVDSAEIVHLGKAIRASCVVMGTRGLTGLPRVLLGSVTDQVLREAPCPVLVVPPGVGTRGGWWQQMADAARGR